MYVELTCKSNFSFLRGASDSREYIARAKELGMHAIGISDINGVYGLPRAYEVIRDQAPEMKLICGAEITFDNRPSIHLIAQTRKAWAFLCRIITQVHAGKEKGKGFLTYDELEFLVRRFDGVQEITCIAKPDVKNDFPFLKRIFTDNLYISICKYLDGVDKKRTRIASELGSTFNLPLVATNDVHYHAPLRRPLQDCVTCIREGTTLDKAGFQLFGNAERYLKSSIQMEALFSDLPEAIENTACIASRCTFSLADLKYTYPKESVPEGHTAKSYLRKLVLEGAMWRYKGIISESIDRQMRRELDFFSKRGEEDYFLTMYDILKEAREKKIVFQGRGSAASSIVCYALGITAVDPISANLLFDRFANDARKDPPDIDVDFEHERREEVIQGIYSRYGRDRAAMVAAVHTYQRDGAYREICKSIGVDVGTKKAEVVRSNFAELAKEFASREIFIGTLTKELHGSPRHLGTHSGGFVITNEPIIESVPIEPAAMDGRTIVQWDKHDLETLGMMKIDILSIGFLTAIRKATNEIGINWQDIPINDQKTYSLIQRAETAGCFQIESRAQMNSLPHTRPSTPYEMTIQVALIRPSMSKGGMSRSYLRGRTEARHGRPFRSGNAAMDKILGRTHGVAMFPDQIMQIAMDVCGFSSAEADQLRRALGKERSADSVDSQGRKLFEAMMKCNIKEELATDILNRTQGFASYGFPEAHAASYGSLAFKSAYLKAHYPAEYLCALINSQPMGFYRIDFLINEAVRNSGVKVLPIHPNKSTWDAQIVASKTLMMGFRDIRRINEDAVNEMIAERKERPFKTIEDFISRTNFDKSVLRHLAISNAFEVFGIDRRHSFWQSIEFKNLVGFKNAGQLSFFDEDFETSKPEGLFTKMTDLEEAVIDYRTLGYSLKGSLMKHLRLEVPHLPNTNSRSIRNLKKNAHVRCAGILLVDQRPPPAKGFGFITLEDEYGTIDLILPPNIYDKYKPVFRSSRFLCFEGHVQRLDDHVTIKASHVESFAGVSAVRSHQPTPRMLDRIEWL
jgi:error-prone DNA polymerase